MIVVADTSPLTALLNIGEADLLPKLFSVVVIPPAVRDELQQSHTDLPGWLRVESLKNPAEALRMTEIVDKGEAEAIELAKELRADRLLIDERKGRALAAHEGVPVIGLLGVLLLAKHREMIPSARSLVERLQSEAGMYLSESLKSEALRTVGE